jgi:hypothetical protein
MNDNMQELKRHVRLLEDHFKWDSGIAEELAELGAQIADMISASDENTTALAAAFAEMRAALDRSTDKLNELINTANNRVRNSPSP